MPQAKALWWVNEGIQSPDLVWSSWADRPLGAWPGAPGHSQSALGSQLHPSALACRSSAAHRQHLGDCVRGAGWLARVEEMEN